MRDRSLAGDRASGPAIGLPLVDFRYPGLTPVLYRSFQVKYYPGADDASEKYQWWGYPTDL